MSSRAESVAGSAAGSADSGAWLRRWHPAPADAVRLLVLPHAGGSAGFYAPLAAALAGRVETACVQYPGRQDRYREPAVDDLRRLARLIADAVRTGADGPRLAIFGHSMGAVLGFELARLLEAAGEPPVALFASARRAPGEQRQESRVHTLDDAGLLAEIGRLGGTDERLVADDELRRLFLPAVRADYRAVETYMSPSGITVSCPVTVLVGDRDPQVSAAQAADWVERTTGGVRLHVLPGGHFYITEQVSRVAEIVSATLARLSPAAVR